MTAAPTCSRPRAGSRPRRTRRTTPGRGTPIGKSDRPASRCSPATSTATGSRTWSTAWATIMDCSGSGRARAKTASGPGPSSTIDKTVASVHALIWADIDGDGKAHELVTGKRVYAHEVEPGATDGSLVAWYHFDPQSQGWVRHVIYQGEPAKNALQGRGGTPRAQGLPSRHGRHGPAIDRHRYRP